MTAHSYRIGVDVGGTFTDLVAVEEGSGRTVTLKVPSTPRAPEQAVLDALRSFLSTPADCDNDPPAVALICHSTTVATNALLGQLHLTPPRVGLLTTEGFRDVLEIGRQARSEVYNLFVVRPRSLVEQRVAALAAADFPALAVTLSSDVDPEYREYERASTTVVTAALRPIVSGYLARLEEGVRALDLAAPLLVMGSHGGMADLRAAAARPAGLLESGPASGLAAAAELARRLELERVLSLDMGGTTAKAGTILHGAPETVTEYEAAGRTHSGRQVRGSGYPVRFPFLDLAEVSAGGGTIAHVDAGGALRVGPMSAGADPGPVCYARGGADPTVTDANLLLGRLNPAHLLGGAMPVDRDAAMRAMAALGKRLNLDTMDLAAGIIRLINADMARALRIVSVERGHDPRRFTMVAFGGGGPLHACALAAVLGVPRVVVPPGPGLFSAAGLLTSPLKVALVRPVLTAATEAHPHELAALLAAMEAEAVSELTRQGAAPATIEVAHTLDLRYAGQSYELAVPAEPGTGDWVDGAVARFHERHSEVYSYASPEHAVEIVAARTTATAPASTATAPAPPPSVPTRATPEPRSVREVYFDEA